MIKNRNIPNRILIIRLSAMGDVILTTPLIRMVRKQFPDASIDFLVKEQYASLLKNNPHLNSVLTFVPKSGMSGLLQMGRIIRSSRYDAVIDLQMNPRSYFFRKFSGARIKTRYRSRRFQRFMLVHFHVSIYREVKPVPLRFLESVKMWNIQDDGKGSEIFPEEEIIATVSCDLKTYGFNKNTQMILMAPGAARRTKCWPPERYAEVGSYFLNNGFQVVLTGGITDREICQTVNSCMANNAWDLSGKYSLQQSAALISLSRLLITNDTGVMHMGSALKKPVVAIFGPTTKHLGFFPFRTDSAVIEKAMKCRPCSYHGTATCPKKHFNCMRFITSDEVIRTSDSLLRKAYG